MHVSLLHTHIHITLPTRPTQLTEEVDNIDMVVNGDNSVVVGSRAPVTISADGR